MVQLALINFTPVFDFFVEGFEEALVEPQYAMVGILVFFALCHSGLAFLRPYGATRCCHSSRQSHRAGNYNQGCLRLRPLSYLLHAIPDVLEDSLHTGPVSLRFKCPIIHIRVTRASGMRCCLY